jgi:hypothetical protein
MKSNKNFSFWKIGERKKMGIDEYLPGCGY